MPSWTALQAAFAQYMPAWPGTTRSHVTRSTGDENSAIVEFTDSPELFGREIRAIAAVDFLHGLIRREVDSWEGRRLGIAVANAPCTSNLRFPTAYGEEHLAECSAPARRRALGRPRVALTADDTAGLFAEDTAFEDLAPNTEFTGASAIDAIGTYVSRAHTRLPYGVGVTVRRTLSNGRGHDYAWIGDGFAGSHRIIGVALDVVGRITRFITTWDAARLDDAAMATLLADILERWRHEWITC
ncbi:hypothetical protein [Streptomyces sp. NPDC050528]|uniref:hypothetical protein n=1 Tax=Streptomyces sp. NPDC050528 TaxID=3365623 RepID=UPI0037AD913D